MNYTLDTAKMIYSISELRELNLSNYKINKLIMKGKLKKLTRKYYENLEFTGEFNEFVLAQAYVERGTICLLSAASFYNLTSVRPMEIYIAISRKDKVYTLPDWPVISINYFTDKRYEEGIVEIKEGFQTFKIYNLDKTVVDIVYYREKIGIEETKEIMINYLNRKDRNLNNLAKYAKALSCEDVINRYMEVLL